MRIDLLGGVRATSADGRSLDVGSSKAQAVLAALALSPGRAVPIARLIDDVWGDDPPRTAEKTLQSYVVRLRKALGPEAVVRAGAAYRLDVEADAIDVSRFQRRLADGDVAAALAEWTGTPLAGVDAPGLAPVVDGLVEDWVLAVETDAQRSVDVDAAAVIGALTELTARFPLRERLWELLMTALYRAGRQADALGAFQTARRHLVEDLGIDPGPRLRALEARILDQDNTLTASAGSAAATARPSGTVTFGVCDIDDLPGLWATHERKTALALARADEVVRATVADHGGHVFATAEGSWSAAFHRADDGAAWAIELQSAIHGEPWQGGLDVRVRVGLHTGATEEDAAGYVGLPAHVAGRLAAAAHGGQVVVSSTTAALLSAGDRQELGTFHLGEAVGEVDVVQLGSGRHPPPRAVDGSHAALPVPPGRLIGRAADLERVHAALAGGPVVTVVGPGGVGKTRLALEAAQVAEHGRAGPWFVELAEIASDEDVPVAVAAAVGAKEAPGRGLVETLAGLLQARPGLLVLDNCEHVIDGAAELAHRLAARCPTVRLLATSREPLGVPAEQVVPVAPLDPSGAGIELFAERAAAVSATFDATLDHHDAVEICRRLDGLPLAIELAAARTASLTTADLVARLDDRLRLLAARRRGVDDRHRTLRATLQWSYDLLARSEQDLFADLSAFSGPFDAAAARVVANLAGLDVLVVDDMLTGLAERSLVTIETGPFGRRYRLLETMRAYGAELLATAGRTAPVAARHARWCVAEAERAGELLRSPDELAGAVRVVELWPNLRAAFDRACAAGDVTLGDAILRPVASELGMRGRLEIGHWAERLLPLLPPDDSQRVLYWLLWATQRVMEIGDLDGLVALVRRYGFAEHPLIRHARANVDGDGDALLSSSRQAVTWFNEAGEPFLAAWMEIVGVAAGLLRGGRLDEHDAFVLGLADRHRAGSPPTFHHWALFMLGYSALFRGDYETAEQWFDQAAEVEVPEGTFSANKPAEARAAFRRGDRRRALEILREHIVYLLTIENNMVATSLVAVEFVTVMAAIGHLPAAARMLGYLETTGEFGARAAETVAADAAREVAARRDPALESERQIGRGLDYLAALRFMRAMLNEERPQGPIEDPRVSVPRRASDE